MTFAEEKVQNHIRENLARYHKRIRVCQMLDYLPCLTEMDKQQIRASVDRHGNDDSVWVFFDFLQRRRGWVQQLLVALHNTNLGDIEEEIRFVYEGLQDNPPSRPLATPAPLVADNGSRAAATARDDSNNPSLDVRQRYPHNVLESGQVRPFMSDDATRPVFSTPDPSLRDDGDYNKPIQETKRPSSSNAMVVVRPKNTENAQKPESSTPIQNKSDTNSRILQVDKQQDDWVTVAGNTSCVSPNQGQLGLGEMPTDAMLLTTPTNSRSSAGNLVQNWDSCQHHPVNNEHFGSMNHLTDHDAHSVSKEPDLTCPRTSENQPEENYYSASDSSLLTPSSQDETQNRKSLNPQVPSTMPSKRFGLSPSDSIGSSSTEVILPISPTVVSGAPSGMVSDHLNSPVQMTDPSSFGTTAPNLGKEEVVRPSRNIAFDPSRASHISNTNEEDYIPCKPGVLTSEPGEITKSGNQMLSGNATNPAYSGGSDRLCMSSYSGSDPLMVSELTQSDLCEERRSGPALSIKLGRRETTARTSSSDNGNHLDDGSIRVLQGRIVQPPSVELTEAPAAVDLLRAPLPLPDSVAEVTDETSSLPGNLAWPTVGLALAFGVFVLLRWLKK